MKEYYVPIEEDLQMERDFYAGELKKKDWKHLKKAGEMFLIHAYSHLFEISDSATKLSKHLGLDASRVQVFGDDEYIIRYNQFNLNLAVGLELIFKSILLRKDLKINRPLRRRKHAVDDIDPERTISFGVIINKHLNKIFPRLIKNTLEEIKNTLEIINLRRNNIAHCSKKSWDSYRHEHRFSYVTLYIYERFFYGECPELTELLLKSIKKAKVDTATDYKPLRITPKSLNTDADRVI